MHPCGGGITGRDSQTLRLQKTLGGHELCPTLDQHLKANELAGEASTVLHLTPTPYSVPPSLPHHVPRFPFARCAGLLHLLILLPTQLVQSSRDASTAIFMSSICICFFICPHLPLQFLHAHERHKHPSLFDNLSIAVVQNSTWRTWPITKTFTLRFRLPHRSAMCCCHWSSEDRPRSAPIVSS